MKKKLVIMSTICALTFAMCACGSSKDAANTNEGTASVESADATADAETTENTDAAESTDDTDVTDDAGATVDADVTADTDATADADTTANTETAADNTTAATGTLTFDIPEGFVESAENYYSYEDTAKLSNINSLALENDGSFDSINSEILLASLEAQLKEASGEDLTLSLLEEENYEINGHRAYKYAIEYEVLGNTFRQLQCIVETDEELHFITFTDINDEGFYDTFEAAADTIRFE